jgi:UDP-N-acetylglucosamine 2-epimerase (hydrolysing)
LKSLLFITGTRADYGKIKSLIKILLNREEFDVKIFVTGMHMLSKYGSTYEELEVDKMPNLFRFINQTSSSSAELILASTISGLSNYINEYKIDLIIVHGDRIEALAGSIIGALNNIRVIHIEGGEISGTIDESIRHAISKFSHIHLVSNLESKKRLIKMGENYKNIHILGSPDIDIMLDSNLPNLNDVKERYNIRFEKYSIVIFHPVTTEYEEFETYTSNLTRGLKNSKLNYVIIYPNNDLGSDFILDGFLSLSGDNFRLIPSIRFEYFLTLLKNCDFIVGNSSAGIREAEVYAIPAINIGTRQNGRTKSIGNVINSSYETKDIEKSIQLAKQIKPKTNTSFGNGNSAKIFLELMMNKSVVECDIQKTFIESD